MPLIEPSNHETHWRADAVDQLVRFVVPPAVAAWWAETLDDLYKAAVPSVAESHRDSALEPIARILTQSSNVAMVEFVARWCGFAPSMQLGLSPSGGQRSLDDFSVKVLLKRACDQKVDFEAGVRALPKSDINVGCLTAFLFNAGIIRLAKILDLDDILRIGRDENQLLPTAILPKFEDPPEISKLDYWLLTIGPAAMEGLIEVFQDESPDRLGLLARGVMKSVDACSRSIEPAAKELNLQNLASHYVNLLHVLIPKSQTVPPDSARKMAWRLAHLIGRSKPELIHADLRKSWVRECTEYWGRFRAELRGDTHPDAVAAKRESLHDAMCVIAKLGSTWQAFKALLLAFRALPRQAVSNDLRYWLEPGEDWRTYEPWCYLARVPAELIHGELQNEQAHDPLLEDFRTKFADFCLERLESREKSSAPREADMVEPDPHWRHCYVRAVRELRVNPAKRGHRTLHWSSQHDPSQDVRDAARVAYNEMSSHVKLEEGRSPRSAIFAAYWWLRQAHLLALGIEPDADGAQRTRIKELRRTKEAERTT